jgi:hypothetical protein
MLLPVLWQLRAGSCCSTGQCNYRRSHLYEPGDGSEFVEQSGNALVKIVAFNCNRKPTKRDYSMLCWISEAREVVSGHHLYIST